MNELSEMPILDGHNDTLLKVDDEAHGQARSFFERSDHGHLDLPRAREAGYAGGFFAICIEDSDLGLGTSTSRSLQLCTAQQLTFSAMARLYRLDAASKGQVKIVSTASQLVACLQEGTLATILHIEGAEAIDPGLDALPVLYRAGLRSLGIVWNRSNAFGHGVLPGFPRSPDTGPGLTHRGLALVRACNELGIVIDVSHLNEKGFCDVARNSAAPLVATHSNAHALCPAARNLTDSQLDAVGDSGGLVGINFHVAFLRADGQENPDTLLSDIVRHVDYIATRIGIDHVAFGSDFDGATMPRELGDVTGLPKLVGMLRGHGYGEEDLAKITHRNWLRVLRQTWK